MLTDYERFASDLPDTGSMTFSCLEEHEELLSSDGVSASMKQLSKGAYNARFASRCWGEVELLSSRLSAAMAIDLEPPADRVAFLFPHSASGRFVASGVDLGNQKLLVMPPGTGAELVVPALSGADSIMIPSRKLSELVESLCPSLDPPESLAVVDVDAARNARLRTALSALRGQSVSTISGEDLSSVLAALMEALEVDSGGEAPDHLPSISARAHIARRGSAFIEERFRGEVRLDVVCRELGVGARTLQRAFREYFGVSLTEYLKLVRLDALRRDLRAADPAAVTVAQLGLSNGFTHLGRMAVDFRRQFCSLPSEVLSRRASPQ